MFTGIIQNLGTVKQAFPKAESLGALIQTGFENLALGESIAVNGVCLTVAEVPSPGDAFFFISPETLSRSNLSALSAGAHVNLERPLTLSTPLSGHLVQGHVDGQARLLSTEPHGEARALTFEIPSSLARYCVEKGSIALDGVSLTINALRESAETTEIDCLLVPHTWAHTRFVGLKSGDFANVEVDVIAKYMERLCRN